MNKKGFTLVELLIVIGLIAVLAILAIVTLTSSYERSRDTKRITDIKQMSISLELYWNDNANYPTVTAGQTSWASFAEELKGSLPKEPQDPNKKHAYTYIVNPENRNEYILASTLENGSHQGLEQDVDGVVGKGWAMVDSLGKSEVLAEAGFDCADPNYCIIGDATK